MQKINELYMPMMDGNTPGDHTIKTITKAQLEQSTKSIKTSRGSQPKLSKIGSTKNSFYVHNGGSQKLAS